MSSPSSFWIFMFLESKKELIYGNFVGVLVVEIAFGEPLESIFLPNVTGVKRELVEFLYNVSVL